MVAMAFSTYSRELFEYAVALSRAADADLVVASVINSRDVEAVTKIVELGYEVNGDHYVQGVCRERRELLTRYVEQTEFPSERIHPVFRVGNPVDELLRIIIEENVDMVVMGVRGLSHIEHAFVGSVAEKVFRRSPVTVVSYRNRSHAEKLRRKIHLK